MTNQADSDGVLLRLLARAEASFIPITAVAELTSACNLGCDFCYLNSNRERGAALGLAQWQSILEQLAASGCLFLVLTGGEPLARPDFFDIASVARTLGFALRILTNGTMVDARAADKLAALLPLGVEISVHGDSAASHDEAVGRAGGFDRAIAAIRLLRARGVPVRMKCVVSRRNIRHLASIHALALSLDATVSFDSEITPFNDGDRAPTALGADPADLVRMAELLWTEPGQQALCEAPSRARLDSPPCAAGRRTLHISASGLVHPCTQWPTPVGDLRTTAFREVWEHSPQLHAIRAIHLRDLDPCASCELLAWCTPCVALSVLERGKPDGKSELRCRTAAVRRAAMGHGAFPTSDRSNTGPREVCSEVAEQRS